MVPNILFCQSLFIWIWWLPQIGFIHRGLEKLVETKDIHQYIYVAERICGICAFGHSYGYAQCVERLMNVEVPERAEYLRTIMHELSRLHSHLLWMGLAADAFGFESLFMHCWRLRERILDIFEAVAGGRVILSLMPLCFKQSKTNLLLSKLSIMKFAMRS